MYLNVNDILTKGARPLFFLDYVAMGNLNAQRMESLLRGMAWACREVGCALIGGETAQTLESIRATPSTWRGLWSGRGTGVPHRRIVGQGGGCPPGYTLQRSPH